MNWTPAIADPTFVGWFAVFAYFSTAILCAFVAARSALRGTAKGRAWWILALVLVVLGVNKQWDLQGFVLEWSRSFASKHGVYEKRRIVQMTYLLLLAITAMTAILLWIWMNRHNWREHGYMTASSIFLVTFVLVRAASFHHFQEFFALPLAGVRLHRFIELFAIACVAASAIKRVRDLRAGSDLFRQ